MIKRIVAVIMLALRLDLTSCQVPGFGGCPELHAVHNFDTHRYLGQWFEVSKYPFIFTLGGKCITAEYGLTLDGKVSVFNKQIRDGKEDTIQGVAEQLQRDVGELQVSFPNVPFPANYKVLDTDYDNFAVVYSCRSFLGLVNGKIIWILTRTRFPPRSVIDRAHEVIKANGLSTSFLTTTDNTDCPDDIHRGIDNFRDQHHNLD